MTKSKKKIWPALSCIPALTGVLFLVGCMKKENTPPQADSFKIVLQTDWYPQPEHGGFYQALVEGYYEEEGLDVEILPGGPNTVSAEKVALGQVQFAMGKSNDIMMYVARGVPLIMVGALLQHDPQALLFHQENPIRDFTDLDGKRIMAGPGSAFLELIRRKYKIEFDLLPLDYGIGQFLRDKEFIQQCFITSEPYFARKQGANPGALLIKESGFDPYHVWYTRSDFVQQHPEIVEKFSRATIKGWQKYLFGNRETTNELLKSLNPKLDDEFIAYSVGALLEHNLVTGAEGNPEQIGKIDPNRIQTEIDQLMDLNLLEDPINLDTLLYNSELITSLNTKTPLNPGELEFEEISSNGKESKILTLPYLTEHPDAIIPFQFTQNETPLTAKIVYLDDVLKGMGYKPSECVVLANCTDQYQSNFGPESFETHKPYIVLEIEGQPTHQWAQSRDHPGWGPYIMGISNQEGLKDPGSKQPWGVEKIILMPIALFNEKKESRWPEPLSASARQGKQLFMNHCLNCHSLDETIGGHVSNRTVQILSLHAKTNPAYIKQMIQEPEKAFPDGIRMPAMPHYSEEDIQAVTHFLAAYSNF